MEKTVNTWHGMTAVEIVEKTTAKIIDRRNFIVELFVSDGKNEYKVCPRESNVNDDGWYRPDALVDGLTGRYAVQVGDNLESPSKFVDCSINEIDKLLAKEARELENLKNVNIDKDKNRDADIAHCAEAAKKYSDGEFELYNAEMGWESWMDHYSDDPEDLSPADHRDILDIQATAWNMCHVNDMIKECTIKSIVQKYT